MTATEVKSRLLAVLDEVAAGDEVEVTKHGKTVARIIPAKNPSSLRGSLAGVAMTAGTEEEIFSTGVEWNLP